MSASEEKSDFRHRFGALVKQRREDMGFTQMAFAKLVLSDETKATRISDIERGRNEPNAETINAVCTRLEIDPAEIELLRQGGTENWPAIFDPSIRMERQVRGRSRDVADLHTRLTDTKSVAIVESDAARGTVVKGAGGMGKSTLARYYAKTYQQQYRGIWWLRAQTLDTLIADLGNLAGHLDLTTADHTTPKALARAAVMALTNEDAPWLLIFDNAETPGAIADWIPKGKTTLVTSREARWKDFYIQEAGRLALPDATDLLMQEAERDTDFEGAESLAKALDGLPLALVLAGSWLRDTDGTSFADYEARIDTLIDLKPEEVEVEDYPDSVFSAVSLSLEKLSDNAALLMRVFAYLSPDDLWPELVTALTEKRREYDDGHDYWQPIPEALWTLAKNRAAVDRAFTELTRRSLLEKVEDDETSRTATLSRTREAQSSASEAPRTLGTFLTQAKKAPDSGSATSGEGNQLNAATQSDPLNQSYRMHRLTSTVQRAIIAKEQEPLSRTHEVRAGTSSDYGKRAPDSGDAASGEGNISATAKTRAITAALLAASYPAKPPYRENWPACARRQPHVATLAKSPPEAAAMDYLLGQASVWLDAQRRDDEALAYDEISLRLKEARLGQNHATVGTACNNLAASYYRAGRMVEAETMAARAVTISEAGETSEANRAIWLSVHGIMAEMVGRGMTGTARDKKLTLAANRYRQALALRRGNNFEARLFSPWINNLADLRAYQGRWGAALPLCGRAMALSRRALPPGDPDIASNLHNLGGTLLQAGRAREGYRGAGVLDLLTEALNIREDAFADNPAHPDRVNTAGWLASAHWALAELGSPITGTIPPDPTRAEALCTEYGLDAAKEKRYAADYVARARLYESGTEPPGQIDA